MTDVTSMIFVASLSSYNLVLKEDRSQNQLDESIHLFRNILDKPWFKKMPILLFLNKQDLFEDKIKSQEFKLERYFPDFEGFTNQPDSRYAVAEDADEELTCGKSFLKDKFLNTSSFQAKRYGHCYSHFTCATDTQSIKRVFNNCREYLIPRANL